MNCMNFHANGKFEASNGKISLCLKVTKHSKRNKNKIFLLLTNNLCGFICLILMN